MRNLHSTTVHCMTTNHYTAVENNFVGVRSWLTKAGGGQVRGMALKWFSSGPKWFEVGLDQKWSGSGPK